MKHNQVDQKFQKALGTLWRADLYEDVPLTAIVVCGDQSSGKSAVLEAISGFRFPISDGMCTRFVTRVEMDKDEIIRIIASIKPATHHSPQRQEELRRWQHNTTNLAEFGQVVLRAGEVMGSGMEKGFLKDELVIRISAPTLSTLVFIDVPGIIQSTRDDQPDSDIDYISNIVTNYMKDTSKIILTVVAATNDLELQGVLRQAEKIDPTGQRFMGVITKPDACEDRPSIQKAALALLKNSGEGKYHWALGWHLLKNRSESQSNMTDEERDDAEDIYLARSPWAGVPDKFKGAENLATRLGVQVHKLFNAALPGLKKKIENLLRSAQIDLDLAKTRAPSVPLFRQKLCSWLGNINNEMIEKIVNAGRDVRDDFGASIEDAAADLINAIRLCGHYYEFDETCLVERPRLPTADVQADWIIPEPRPVDELRSFAESVVVDTKADAGQMIDTMYKTLFKKQIEHWPLLLQQYIRAIKDILEGKLTEVSSRFVPQESENTFNDMLVATQVEAFACQLTGRIQESCTSGKLRGKHVTEAVARAWKAQYNAIEEQRLQQAFGINNNNDTSTKGQNTKRDYQTILNTLKNMEIDIAGFPAKQAIATMQLSYITRTDDIRPLWNEKAILNVMQDFFTGWSERVTLGMTDEQIRIMFNENAFGQNDLIEGKRKVELYEECLAALDDL